MLRVTVCAEPERQDADATATVECVDEQGKVRATIVVVEPSAEWGLRLDVVPVAS